MVNDSNSGSTLVNAQLPEGTTTIVWTITDIAGNIATCSYDVTVNAYVGIADLSHSGILAYPNPAKNTLKIQSENDEIQKISVYGNIGTLLYSQVFSSKSVEIDIKNLQKGMYIFLVQTKKTENSVLIFKE